ncbi:MAG: putative redox protein [Polaribacter sp.]|jgi:putative redox protein
MQITTKWKSGQKFSATTENGHTIKMDGEGSAPSPLELILAAVGGCSSIDVVMILEKGRHQISDCRCELEAERADAVPSVFTKIHAHYLVSGTDLPEKAVERACKLSIEKYCSAALMLNESVEITYTYEVVSDNLQ